MKVNKFFYYFLNFTWGIIMNIIGFLVFIIAKFNGNQSTKWGGVICTTIPGYWGGIDLGLFSFVDEWSSNSTKNHEYGHSIQNALLGPFFIFLVAIPSLIRAWIFDIRYRQGKQNPPYDSIWFEGQATRWGNESINQWKKI